MNFKTQLWILIGITIVAGFLLRFFIHLPIAIWEDHDIAVNLLQEGEYYYLNDGTKNHTFQFPIYPVILSLVYAIIGIKPAVVCLLNIVIHGLTALILSRLFRELSTYFLPESNEKIKNKLVLFSVAAYLFHPALNFYALDHVHPFSLNLLTIFSGFYFSWRCVQNPNRKNILLTGLIIGIGMLDRATIVVTLVPFFMMGIQLHGWIKTIKHSLVICTICLIVISPWLAHNYYTDGIIGFESSAAKNKWKGVLKNSDGGNFLNTGETYYAALSTAELDALAKMNPIQQRDFFNAKYNQILFSDPGHVTAMFFTKLKNFWWFRPNTGEELGALKKFLPLYKIVYGIVLLLILMLMYFEFKKTFMILLFPIALSLLQAYFYVEMRHRIILEPLLFFLAATSIFYFIHKKKMYG